MNRKQIIAELRRSAMEDADPWVDVDGIAFSEQLYWRTWITPEITSYQADRKIHMRTFYLLVACALEDEQ